MLERLLQAPRWVLRNIGHRGWILIPFGVLDLSICIGLLEASPDVKKTVQFQQIQQLLPVNVWAVLWGVTGLLSVVMAFTRRDTLAFVMGIAIQIFWGFQYLYAWAFGGSQGAWAMALLWAVLAIPLVNCATWDEEPERQVPMEIEASYCPSIKSWHATHVQMQELRSGGEVPAELVIKDDKEGEALVLRGVVRILDL